MILSLNNAGIDVEMLTVDNEKKERVIAEEVGIKNVQDKEETEDTGNVEKVIQ